MIKKLAVCRLVSILLASFLSISLFSQWEFKENKGQWPDQVSYAADIPGGRLYLENDRLTFNIALSEKEHQDCDHNHGPHGPVPTRGFAYQLVFQNAKASQVLPTSAALDHKTNYFLGNDPSKWASNVSSFPSLSYQEIYPGIDIELKGSDSELKYDLICKPGSNPRAMSFKMLGFDNRHLSENKLHFTHPEFNIVERIPRSYQIIGGDTIDINCFYQLNPDGTVSYDIGRYNPDYTLVIDPSLVFSTYSGSTADNFGFTATYDNEGFLYGGGNAYGNGYPTNLGVYDRTYNGGSFDVVVTKFDTTGTKLIYSTYLGGNDNEQPHSIVVNEFGELYVLGTTGSSNYPTTAGAIDRTFNGGPSTNANFGNVQFNNGLDIFISRLSADGTALLSSTFLGGTENDGFNGIYATIGIHNEPPTLYNYADEFRGEIDIDESGNVYIASSTFSPDFPITPNAFQSTLTPGSPRALSDAVLCIINPSLSNLLYSTFLGGSGTDVIHSIAVKPNEILFAGGTSSSDILIPTTKRGFQANNGGATDGFFGSINRNGFGLNFLSYLGATRYDQIYFIEFDKQDFIYVFGQTEETGNFFTQGNPSYNDPAGGLFVTKFSPDGKTRLLSATIGTGAGLPRISPTAFLVDNCQRIYIAGWGTNLSGQYPNLNTAFLPVTPDAFDGTSNNPGEQYLAVFGPDMSNLVYGTYIGDPNVGEHVDGGTSRFDKKGIVYQAVCASCGPANVNGFPTTPGAHSSRDNSQNCNMAVFKFDLEPPLVTADFSIPAPGCLANGTVNFGNLSTPAEEYKWDFGDGNNSTDSDPTHTYSSPGTYTVTLVANRPTACNISDTIRKDIQIFYPGTFTINDTIICAGEPLDIGPDLDPSLPMTSFQWDNHPDINDVNNQNPTVRPTTSVSYRAVAMVGGCELE
ncbi:MAG: PKD domain-containing protein, partial [Luteibaculum sp.]